MTEQEIFIEAMNRSAGTDRDRFLDEACGDDHALSERVAMLIQRSEMLGSFMEHSPAEAVIPGPLPDGEPTGGHEATVLSPIPSPQDDDCETAATSEEIPMHHDSSDSDDEIPLGYLQPSSRAGSLGRLGHYEIEAVIGSGAFGTVLKAFDDRLHRVVAIKVLSPQLAATSPARKRFLREARSSAAVRHENVVSIYAVEDEAIPYLVMEYVPGQTLQQRLEGHGPLDVADVLRLGKQIAEGLAAAHAQGLIHRDIKPGNILLDTSIDDRVKITDFGLARTADDASMTQSGMIAGTPLYMAPEQARAETLDHRADLFSLGSVLYQMVSGRPPFRAGNTIAVLKRVCEDTPRPIQDIIPEVPAWLSVIIFRLLEKDRENRFQSAQEVAELLGRCRHELDSTGQVRSASGDTPTQLYQPEFTTVPPADKTNDAYLRGVKYGIAMMLVVMVLVFVISPRIARWLDTPIPSLPAKATAGGLTFDGRDDHVEITGLDWNYPQFTLEAFMTPVADSDNGTIAFLGNGQKQDQEWMSLFDGPRAAPGKRISGAAIRGKTKYENAYGPIMAGQRQHRALVFDGRHLHYYINGVWQGERTTEAQEGLQWNMTEMRLGCDGTGREFFEGTIDLVRVSRVARYTENFAPVSTLPSDDQTLAIYHFDEGSGDILHDTSGNGHDGRIVGAKWVNAADVQHSETQSPRWQVTTAEQKEAIRWVLSQHGNPTYVSAIDNQYHWDLPVNPTLPDDPVRWLTLGLNDLKLTDENYERLLKLPDFAQGFSIHSSQLSEAELKRVLALPCIQKVSELTVAGGNLTDESVRLFRRLPLTFITVAESHLITDHAVQILSDLKPNRLEISGCRQITSRSFETVGRISSLTYFMYAESYGAEALREADLAHLQNLPDLKSLVLRSPSLTDSGLKYLETLPSLTELDLVQSAVTESGVKQLAAARPQLKIQWNGGTVEPTPSSPADSMTKPTEPVPTVLTPEQKAAIQWLWANNGPSDYWSADGVLHHDLTKDSPIPDGPVVWWNFRLAEFKLSDADYEQFSKLPDFHLGFRISASPHIRDQELRRLLELPCFRRIKEFNMGETQVTDEGLLALRNCPLNLVDLFACSNITDHGIAHLTSFPLWYLNVTACKQVTSAALQSIGKIHSLEHLGFTGAYGGLELRDSDISQLSQLTNLKLLALSRTSLADADLEHFSPLTKLRELRLDATKVTEAGVAKLAESLPACRIIWDGGTVEPRVNADTWHQWPAGAPVPAIAPFNARQAKAHQEAWAKYLGVPVEYTNSIGMKFRLIPPGEFLMGSTPEEIEAALKISAPGDTHLQECFKSEGPQHRVVLTRPVYLGITEVTQTQYVQVMGNNPAHFSPSGEGKDVVANLDTRNHPVEMVSWKDAAEFCAKLSETETLNPFYFRSGEVITPLEGTGYRLPTEAEWEFACRAGSTTRFWSGNDEEDVIAVGWFDSNAALRTHPAGELPANPFGLADMHGNISEWVQDGWEATAYGQFTDSVAVDPSISVSTGTSRVVRGGFWHYFPARGRSSARYSNDASQRFYYWGFRTALSVDAVRKSLSEN